MWGAIIARIMKGHATLKNSLEDILLNSFRGVNRKGSFTRIGTFVPSEKFFLSNRLRRPRFRY